jgi:hypothetical protein
MNLYRKTKRLEFDDGAVTVSEISAGALLRAELEGRDIDVPYLLETCTDADIDEITTDAYKKIVDALVELNAPLFSEETGTKRGRVKKK